VIVLRGCCGLHRESTAVSDDNRKLENVYKPWAPGGYVAFRLLLAARMCAALWSNVSDCDEIYNYWEPVHLALIPMKNNYDRRDYFCDNLRGVVSVKAVNAVA